MSSAAVCASTGIRRVTKRYADSLADAYRRVFGHPGEARFCRECGAWHRYPVIVAQPRGAR